MPVPAVLLALLLGLLLYFATFTNAKLTEACNELGRLLIFWAVFFLLWGLSGVKWPR
jgi:Kef-type K+ transport system membrane component KefB